MGSKKPAGLARLDHVDVQGVKYVWRASHGGGERRAAFDLATRVDQDFLEKLVLLLASENLETLHEWKTSVDHDGELAGEDCQFLGLHTTAELGHVEFFALLGHLCGSNLLAFQPAPQFGLF